MTEFQSNRCGIQSYMWTNISSKKTHTLCWKIEGFSKLPVRKKVRSSTFRLLHSDFLASFRRTTDDGCFISFRQKNGSEIYMKLNIFVTNGSSEQIIHAESTMVMFNAQNMNCKTSVHRFRVCKAPSDDLLNLKCVMEWDAVQTDCLKLHPNRVSPLDNLTAMPNALKDIGVASLYPDVGLKVGDNVLQVHKSLLCARSPVLARMLAAPTDDKNIVEVTDLQLPVLEDFVCFLYTGELRSANFEVVCALYYVAEKYEVSILKEKCVGVLISRLDATNACRLLRLAELHSNVEMRDFVLGFIEINFDKILETCSWIGHIANLTQLIVTLNAVRDKKRAASKARDHE